jgi:hypothetical protein
VQTALHIAQKHCQKALASRDSAHDDSLFENQNLSAAFNQFVIDVSMAVTDEVITLEDFLASSAGSSLVDRIIRLKSSNAELRYQSDSETAIVTLFSQRFNRYFQGSSDPASRLKEARAAFHQVRTDSLEQERKIRDPKANSRAAAVLATNIITSLKGVLNSRKPIVGKLVKHFYDSKWKPVTMDQ